MYSSCVYNWSLPQTTFPSGLSGLSATLDTLHKQVEASLATFHPALLSALKAASVPESATSTLSGAPTGGLLTSLNATVSDIKEHTPALCPTCASCSPALGPHPPSFL